jgi:hypothetical protein
MSDQGNVVPIRDPKPASERLRKYDEDLRDFRCDLHDIMIKAMRDGLQAADIVHECLGQASATLFNLLEPPTELEIRIRAAVTTACAEISKAQADSYGLRPPELDDLEEWREVWRSSRLAEEGL